MVKKAGRICERCGKKIAKARIDVLPETRLCVRCSEIVGGDYEVEVVEDVLGGVHEGVFFTEPSLYRTQRDIESVKKKK